jgi:hypothetical protein
MISEKSLEIIQCSTVVLKKPVRIVVFTADRGCPSCPDALELARLIKDRVNRSSVETYDLVMDRDKTVQYGISHVPATVLESMEGETVTFYGQIEELFLEIFMNTLTALADARVWFPDDIRRTLKHLTHDVKIRVFVDSDCPQCRPVAETAIGLALESRLIDTDIIIASDFPDLIKTLGIAQLPKTIFGENIHMDGHVMESEFLERIFQAEGIKRGTERKCLVCGMGSSDLICMNCKTRIQAEAIDHKTRIEKGMQL